MTSPLYQYQADVIPQMKAGAPTYLGFDPGLGKSRTALEAAKARGVKALLIICPASGRYVWERECRQWWPQMPFRMINGPGDLSKLRQDGIVLITYGLLSQKDSVYASLISKNPSFNMTILDEAAAVKNGGANRTRAILKKMLPKLGYLVPMSGTPAPNHAGELFPILQAIYPQALLKNGGTGAPMNQFEFEDTFCKVVHKRFGTGRDIRVIEGSKNLDDLRRRMSGFMMRVKKADVMKDLPPIRWDVVPVQPDAPPTVRIEEGLSDDDLIKYLSGATGEEHVMKLRHQLGVAKVKAAVEYIEDFLTNLPQDRKVLVFAHHRDVIEHLKNSLINWSPAVIVGALGQAERASEINRFLYDDRCRMLIGNIAAAGTGLTLVGPKCKCSDVIFVEATYSVGDNDQAACRVHRIGQHDAVVARMLDGARHHRRPHPDHPCAQGAGLRATVQLGETPMAIISLHIEADSMADLISQVRMLIGQHNREPAPPEGADVNVDRKATSHKKRAVRPPVAETAPVKEVVEEQFASMPSPDAIEPDVIDDVDDGNFTIVGGKAVDVGQLLKLKNDTISVLQDAFAQGKVVKLRKLLMTHGDGAKSFPEVDPVKFIEISEAVKAGALNG